MRFHTRRICGTFGVSPGAVIVILPRWAIRYSPKQPAQAVRTLIGGFSSTQNPFLHLAHLLGTRRSDDQRGCESAPMGHRLRAQATRLSDQNGYRRLPLCAEPVSARADILLLRRFIRLWVLNAAGSPPRMTRRPTDRNFPHFLFLARLFGYDVSFCCDCFSERDAVPWWLSDVAVALGSSNTYTWTGRAAGTSPSHGTRFRT
jgi:hypothetical protein